MNQRVLAGLFILLLLVPFGDMVPSAAAIVATGGTLTVDGTTNVRTFTSSGFFCVTSGTGNVNVFVLAGGGGGDRGGGGGGGYRTNSSYPVHVGCYTVTIGAGGAAASGGGDNAANGGNSVFGNLTSTGGGAGRYNVAGVAGGSGGGGGGAGSAGGAASPAGQGSAGGTGTATGGGGGGGASAVGGNAGVNIGGNGGAGTSNSYSGASVCYGGGGGGGANPTFGTATCGGGNGAASGGSSGTANRGGGGGGIQSAYPAGSGSSGIVIVRYTTNTVPDPVTTLHSTNIDTDQVTIAWTAPSFNDGTCQGYRINYTTPFGAPTTILQNNTGVGCAVSYTVSPLTIDTDYSFRVSGIGQGGLNINGANILNVTTLAFDQANYTIGSFDFSATNPNIFPIRYEKISNGTSPRVNVTFSNTMTLACDLRYTYAGTNHTYHSVSSIPVSSTEREASFKLVNASNEIITFHCWNQLGNQSANYVLTQTDFLLLQQVRDFRNGTYGTQGQLGAFDFITLIVVIIAMIGLNRNTESVAGFFCIVAVSVLAYFGIIQWYIALISAVAVITLFAIAATRKT